MWKGGAQNNAYSLKEPFTSDARMQGLKGMVPGKFYARALIRPHSMNTKKEQEAQARYEKALDAFRLRHAGNPHYKVYFKVFGIPRWQENYIWHTCDPRQAIGSPFSGGCSLRVHRILDNMFPRSVEREKAGINIWFVLRIERIKQ